MFVTSWIIVLTSTFLQTDNVIGENTQKFRQATCKQIGKSVQCEDVTTDEGPETSDWPPGVYSIPMPITGCPETDNRGWREGYISMKWLFPRTPYSVKYNYSEQAYNVSQTKAINGEEWPKFESYLSGSFKEYLFRLNFCTKQRRSDAIDIGTWPEGSYSIYGDPSGCPTGFTNKTREIYLGQIEYWTSGGYVPEFEMETILDSAVTLRLTLCSRDVEPNTPNTEYVTMENNAFLLIKDTDSPCPRFDSFSFTEESVYLDGFPENHTDFTLVQSHCFYRPNQWNTDTYRQTLLEKFDSNGNMILNTYLLEGNKSIGQQSNGNDLSLLHIIESQFQDTTYVPWKLIDMGRSLSIIAVWLKLIDGASFLPSSEAIPSCFLSNEKWCFLYACALKCLFYADFKRDTSTLQLLFVRPMTGRYIALAAGDQSDNALHISTDIEVFTDKLINNGKSVCNIDLGMTDGGILDFQISASSFQRSFPPSQSRPFYSGWCSDSLDNNPFIQVDLLVETSVEGVTIWNWQETITTMDDVIWDTVVHFGVDKLSVFYAKTKQDLIEYHQEFHFDMTRPLDEPQTFWFLKPITARYIKLQINKSITEGLNCLKFELLGCRVSGIPSLTCLSDAEMFPLSNVPLVSNHHIILHNVSTHEDCSTLCLQSEFCSTVSFTPTDNDCIIFSESKEKKYQIYHTDDDLSSWSTKLCYRDQFISGPRLHDTERGDIASANVYQIEREGIISSPRYPFTYQSGHNFKWIIKFEPQSYVKLAFTNISLNKYEDSTNIDNRCEDSILISNAIRSTQEVVRVLDYRFNGVLSVIETSESVLIVTLKSCLPRSKSGVVGRGFRAIVRKNYMPACFTLDSTLAWQTGREETCTQSSMLLTSMSLLGLPFSETTEQWKILSQGKRILISFEEFHVKCKTEEDGSEFLIRDLEMEKSFCNLNRPPVKYYSASDTVIVTFYKGVDPPYITFKEGFRLTYITEKVSMEQLISYRAYRSNITNVALGKPAIMSSLYIYKSRDFLSANKGTDGTIHLDAAYGACFHTKTELEPWWMVDLQGIYIIDRVVLYNKQENTAGPLARNIEISVGTSMADMRVTSYLCLSMAFRKTFDQHNIRGRYVMLQVRWYRQKFHLCEVEVYGVLETDMDQKYKRNIPYPDPVQGNWNQWGSWSNLCYSNGKQPRIRKCDNPKPSFGGSRCIGSDIGYRSCLPVANGTLYNVAFKKSSRISSQEYSWSSSYLATDGIILQTKLSCFQTKFEYQPWWMIDLQGIFELEKIKVFSMTDCCPLRTQNAEISVGVSCEMKVVHSNCGGVLGSKRTLWMIGYTARYVKIQLMGRYDYLSLCEIEIYGQPALNESETSPRDDGICDNIQDGRYSSWTQWSECSEKCGIGKMTRTRVCDSPAPANGGKYCYGDDKEIQNCVGRGNCPFCSETFGKCYSLFPKLTNWKDAGLECWKRKMKLVSLRSREELRFINYLLRENRYADKQPLATFDSVFKNASYYAHLGLYRYPMDDGTKIDVWEDRTPVTFTAWKFGEPSDGSCVRMNYKSFDDRNTWESEDCESVLAEYFICEQKIINESMVLLDKEEDEMHGRDWQRIPEHITSGQYLGKEATTKSGYKCMAWEEQAKEQSKPWWQTYTDRWWVTQNINEADNYCRDPAWENYVWCHFKISTNVTYREECSAELPVVENTRHYQWRYMGKWNKTFTGKTCQFWNTLSPHSHHTTGYNFPGETINSVDNFCRDIWNSGYLWCYTTDQDTRWEMCIVEDNPKDRCSVTHYLYAGKWNIAYTGKLCLRWDDVEGHIRRGFKDHMFPERSITAAGNSCRDPFGDGYLWCYVTYYSWEPCAVEDTRQQAASLAEEESTVDDVFECTNGELILKETVCDEKFDCEDLSDETNCLYKDQRLITATGSSPNDGPMPETFLLSSYFKCGNNDWISVTARCDGVKDCLDASDEINCTLSDNGMSECSDDQFRCDDGDCIHISEVCNFIDDCIDGSDEYCDLDECEKTEFRCVNGQCVPLSERCNGSPQCLDDTDEKFCDACIEREAFHCDIVKCIPLRLVCDKYRDCQDGSDEMSCTNPDLISCEQWWEAGYRESRNYIIGGLTVFCDFDSVMVNKKMSTIIRNFDILWRDGDGVGYLYSRDTLREEDVRLDEIIKRPNYRCVQKVTQSCIPSHKSVAEYDDPLYQNNFKHCECLDQTIVVGLNSKVEHCNRSNTNLVNKDDLIYVYNISIAFYRKIVVNEYIDYVKQGYQIVPGAAFCEYDYDYEENVTTCKGDVKNIPASIFCVYDLDASGYKLGCRSGSHLQNCESHVCQEGTVKCPGSYCIPLRFVCDGKPQCPGGEDEEGCGCDETENEILILYDSDRTTSKTLDVYNFAKLLSSPRNTIRVLSFVVTQPLVEFSLDDAVLQITDTVIQAKSALNRVQQCKYNIIAKNAIENIHLSAQKSKGIIYIQDDSAFSMNLFDTMFTSVAWNNKNVSVYRIRETQCNETGMVFTANVIEIRVRRWKLLNTIGAEYLPRFCKARTKVGCLNKYRCKWSKVCLPLNQVCDGHTQCPHKDDEMLCNFKCPEDCFCVGYKVNCSNNNFTLKKLNTISNTTRQLDISFNTNLQNIFTGYYLNNVVLVKLNLSSCDIIQVSKYSLRKIKNLVSLDLSFNSINVIKKNTFSYLTHLRVFILKGNFGLYKIESGAFDALSNIYDLNLANARLTKIKSDTFSGLVLQSIDLSNNSIEEIEDFAFRNLAVKSINFEKNKIAVFRKEIFTGVDELETLRTPAFKFCCIRPNYLPEEGCYPPKDEFSSCEDLMRLSALQTMLWLIGISALVGNALTILYRLIYDRSRLRLGFGIFVTNLAVADFLMGVYLLIIAVADAIFRKRYIFMDEYWRNSAWCNLAGVLSTISSEASVFFLCLITMDRLFVIKFPFGQIRFDKRKSLICSGTVWFVCLFLAVLPILYESYFQNKFYTKSGVCIALPLTRDRPPGWVYSVVIFVGLNFATFVLVAFGQWSIFMEIRSVSGGMEKTSTGRKNDLKVARNLLLVVLTDFLCWFPIGVMGMMALYGHVISGDVYAWSAVFILPINSALNPILYTISSIIGRKVLFPLIVYFASTTYLITTIVLFTTFNPDTDEQSRTEMSKEFGSHILNFQRVSRHFSVIKKRRIPYKSINSLMQSDDRLKPIITAKAVYQLAKCLDVLHNSSLVIGELNTNTVCVGVVKGKITGEVQIEKEPQIANSNNDSKEDIFNVGKILRIMLSKCKQSQN